MRLSSGILFLCLTGLASGSGLGAESAPAPVLGGPEIVKLDWNIRRLIPADLNQDGRTDLALINNDRARIEVLLQRDPGSSAATTGRRVDSNRWEPVLEDSRFDKVPVTVGITLYDLAAGDLNGDGLTDLAYTGLPDSLTVRFQSEEGDWEDRQVLDIGAPSLYITSLLVEDLDGDGRDDLLVLLEDDLAVLRQNEAGRLEAPERYAFSDEDNHSLRLVDLDLDGRKDVIYLAANSRDSLRVRFQRTGGRLGPENPFRIEGSRTSMELLSFGEAAPPGLAHIQSRTAMLTVLSLLSDDRKVDGADAIKPRVYSTGIGTRTPPGYAFGDLDGDGRLDLVVTDPDGAQLLVYFQEEGGELGEARRFPSLADGRSVAAVTWVDRAPATLYMASPKERLLGWTRLEPGGRLHYPRPVPLEGKPLMVAASQGGPGSDPQLAVAVADGGKRLVHFMRQEGGTTEIARSVELVGLKTDPKAIRFLDINRDGRDDLAVFIPFEAMRILVQLEDGGFEDLSRRPDYRSGLVDKLEPSAVTLAHTNGPGSNAVLVAGAGFARAIELDEDGALQVADQFNARESTTEIAAAFALDLSGDGQREILLFDQRNREIQVLRRNDRDVFIYSEAVPVGDIKLVAGHQIDFNDDGREDLFLLGKDRFWVIPMGIPGYRAETVLSYETDLEDIRYGDTAVGDLNNDGTSDLIALDVHRNLVEVLTRTGHDLHSSLHFKVFESDPNTKQRGSQAGEPREALIADLTGDGRNDLVLLVHDRVLLYPSE